MSEEERDILVTKRKYWTKLMKYNVIIYIFMLILTGSFDLPSIELFIFGILLWCWPVFILKYYYLSREIDKINMEQWAQNQNHPLLSSSSVSSSFAKMGQETRKEIGDVLDKKEDIDENINENKVTNPKEITEFQESEVVFSAGIVLMAIYALFILFIDHPSAACTDSNIEEMIDCMNRANLFFKGLSFMGAIGLILSLIGIYTKIPRSL